MLIRIGSRASELALRQTYHIAELLKQAWPDLEVEVIKISTKGDEILDRSLQKIGDKGLFVKEIEEALLRNEIDLAVHSAKDMPSIQPEGLTLAGYVTREDSRDALLLNRELRGNGEELKYIREDVLPKGAKVGTSSARRMAILLNNRPDLKIEPVRGNVQTRIRKLTEEGFDAIVLAAAGLNRLDLSHLIDYYLHPSLSLPAAGQGILAIESRKDDEPISKLLEKIKDRDAEILALAERSFLTELGGGCQVAIGSYASMVNQELRLEGAVYSRDGKKYLRGEVTGPIEQAHELGTALGQYFLSQGAKEILAD